MCSSDLSSASPTNYPAVAGYDLCTGWGTPNGMAMINALTGPIVPTPVIVSGGAALQVEGCAPANGVIDPDETVTVALTLRNTGTSSLNWTSANGQNWVTVSPSTGTLAAGESIPVTVSLNAAAI